MKLVTFEVTTVLGKTQRIGAIKGERTIIDLNLAYSCYLATKYESKRAREIASFILPPNMIAFFNSGKEGREAAELAVDFVARQLTEDVVFGPDGERLTFSMEEVKLKAPVPRPNSIRDYLAFEGHASLSGQRELAEVWYQMPVCYKGNPDTVIGPEDVIPWPSYTDRLDYELEYGIYIGKKGKNIPREQAIEYIAGYTIFNDVSARDIQSLEMTARLGPAKGKDFCSVMGPCLVTPDEINPSNLRMIARVNGEVWSEGNSGTSYWTWAHIIEFASWEETLQPGDFLGSGTVEKGCGIELNRWLQPGDVIELEVEGIGILRNRVGEKPPKRKFTR